MTRLGGEYFDPKARAQAMPVQVARQVFLSRIETVAPEVLMSLRADVLPRYSEALHTPGVEDWMLAGALAREAVLRQVEQWPALAVFASAYEGWAERWGLSAPWIRDVGLATLDHWHRVPELTRPEFHGRNVNIGWRVEVGPPAPRYRPLEESAEAFTARVDHWRRAALAEGAGMARAAGWKLAPTKRARDGADPGLHFEWLARSQCRGESDLAIATTAERDASSVRRAVKDAAALIGVTLRK